MDRLVLSDNTTPLHFIASAPRGLADLLARELKESGATEVRERSTGVAFLAPLEVAYRACLWSRTANRVFLELGELEAASAEEFYSGARRIDWAAHIGPGATIACDFTGRHPSITHTHFGALKLKDAIVDQLRDEAGFRPDVSLERPAVRIHAHANRTRIALSLDLSGESLHRRGYRGAAGEAPLKENVAAGVLLRAGWPGMAASGAEFLDPMCGSGTFVIEAAMIAAEMAPALSRDYFGFLGWRQHDADLWNRLRTEALSRARASEPLRLTLRGQDRDSAVIRTARANAQRAGVAQLVSFETRSLEDARPHRLVPNSGEPLPDGAPAIAAGLLCVNPPYGIRLEDHQKARDLHKQLGEVLRTHFGGWQAAILTGSPDLGLELGIRAHRTHTMWNGAIECRLLRLKVEPSAYRERIADRGAARVDAALSSSPGARMFANRLSKNLKQLQHWVRDSGVSCYRVYDADMPEYAFAVDSYRVLGEEGEARESEGGETWLHVQEYAAPASIEEEAVRRRRAEAFSVLPEVTGVPAERIRVRVRRRQTRGNQYQKVAEQFRFHIVEEGGLKFRVNFDDYLDTGIFLDHRPTRARLREVARGKRFLNLFSYTGTVTVFAAAGGAASTTSVDLSRTYLDWAQRNLALNRLAGRQHELVQADCREWLAQATRARSRYDLIFLDPPTFSNSKRMEGVLDTGRDHPELIDACMRVLAPGGLLVFSTNAQKFKLDADLASRYDVSDISGASVPRDFERNPRIHRSYDIRHRGSP